MDLNATHTMADNLRTAQAENIVVQVHLDSGLSLSARIGEVGEHLVHMKKIVGREFFDALIAIDRIVGMEIRTRTA